MTIAREEQVLEKIREQGVFFIPPGALTSELHLAAFFQVSRRTIMETLMPIADNEEEGVDGEDAAPKALPCGYRRLICNTAKFRQAFDRLVERKYQEGRRKTRLCAPENLPQNDAA